MAARYRVDRSRPAAIRNPSRLQTFPDAGEYEVLG
jgi:hypothetical protein